MGRAPGTGKLVKELQSLEKQHGALTPQLVVDAARSVDSPLHDSFDWNDESAADKYRLSQARQMITTVQVEFADRTQDAFFHVQVSGPSGSQGMYLSSEKVISDIELHAQVVDKARQELEYWQRKYDELQEAPLLLEEAKKKLSEE